MKYRINDARKIEKVVNIIESLDDLHQLLADLSWMLEERANQLRENETQDPDFIKALDNVVKTTEAQLSFVVLLNQSKSDRYYPNNKTTT